VSGLVQAKLSNMFDNFAITTGKGAALLERRRVDRKSMDCSK
jgi:hypothetical protein